MFQRSQPHDEYKHTTEPIVVGASVLAIKCIDGVAILSDTGASYGSLARHTNIERIKLVNSQTLLSYSGEVSDWQNLENDIERDTINDGIDGVVRPPQQIHAFVSTVMHHHRNKANPLYMQLVTAGIDNNGIPFLGYTDLYGTTFIDNVIATGFGLHMALPLLRRAWRPDLTVAEAKTVLDDAMRVLIYRHCRAINKFQYATMVYTGTKSDHPQTSSESEIVVDRSLIVTNISEPYEISTEWNYNRFVHPYQQEMPLPTLQ